MAQAFPHAQIVGLDIAPNRLQTVPSNCKFELWDINKSLTPFYEQFNFVHMRLVHGVAVIIYALSFMLTKPKARQSSHDYARKHQVSKTGWSYTVFQGGSSGQ